MNRLSKICIAASVSVCLLVSTMVVKPFLPVFADIPHIEGGVSGDVTLKAGVYQFDEVDWLTGEPVVMTGTVTIPPTPTTAKYKLTYSYDLSNTTKKATLSRKITYDVEKIKNASVNQTTYKVTISKLDETYTVGSDTYTIGSYIFNKTMLEDNTPSVDYYSGSSYIKRVFYKNGDVKTNTGKVTVVSNTDTLVGYKHRWGNSETQIITENITGETVKAGSGTTPATTETWKGTAQLKMSTVEKDRFDYVKTDPQNISFRGNYTEIRQQENLLQYTYDMPTVGGTTISDTVRNKGEKNIKRTAVMDTKALITPKLRDTTGHWAEKQILLATSLELFSAESNFFAPDTKITRKDFIKGLVRVLSDVKPLTDAELIKRTRGAGVTVPFPDIASNDPDISFYEFAKTNNMIVGENEYFYGSKSITRAEMITAVINTLGISEMAPQPPYKTSFRDDSQIPFWAKDAIYMANEVGLSTGYQDGTVKPNQYVTRAEAAAMYIKLIDHLRETISYDYRDQLINR